MTDTTSEAVERLAAECEQQAPAIYDDSAGVSTRCGHHRATAATLRALAAERDAAVLARAEAIVALNNRDRERMQAEREARKAEAERDALRAEVAARVEAARREGIEAAAAQSDCGCASRQDVLARYAEAGHKRASYLCSHGDACCALNAIAIRALTEARNGKV
jgi:hypothetical protein